MANKIGKVSKKRKVGSLIIILFCFLVTASVISVLLHVYEPNQNSLGALASVCMDAICMLLVLILVLNFIFELERFSRTTKLFLAMMLGTLWALFMDFLNWAFDGSLIYGGWTHIFTMLSLCMGSVLAFVFVAYLASYMDDMYGLNSVYKSAGVCMILNVVAFVITFVLGITNKAFEYTDGHYETGALYDVLTIIPVLTLLYMTGYAVWHIKIIGLHDVIAVVGFIFLMITGALIEAEFVIGTTFVAITVADIFVFVMLQNKLIDEAHKNVEKWRLRSKIDEMTGLYNRQAYEDEMSFLTKTPLKDNFVYVSMDVNSLKITNDTLGHEAGDELIVGACECMKQCFGPYGKIFRTGGDEFVAILYVDRILLANIKKDMEEVAENWHGKINNYMTISYGYVTGQEAGDMSLHQIAIMAEKRMYEDKTKYYHKKGIDRRGQRDAHVALCAQYTKILRANITKDTYRIITMDMNELIEGEELDEKLSVMIKNLVTQELVHPDDIDEFNAKTNLEYLSECFKAGKKQVRIIYRRKYDDSYYKTMLEIIPDNNYSDEAQSLFMYVKNIEETR